MSITINIRELIDLVALAGYDTDTLHAQTDHDEYETAIVIEPCPAAGILNDDNQPEHYRLIAYFEEYPEEGCLGLGEKITPPAVATTEGSAQ